MTSAPAARTYKLPFVISASAAGTIIEWYDFYLYGVLAAFFSTQFFPKGNDTAALLASLATFGAGFAVRPFGAAFFGRLVFATPFFVFFGRLSDRIGRKPIILGGCLIAAISYYPIYTLMVQFAHPQGTLNGAIGKFVGPDGVTPSVAQPEVLPLMVLVWIQVVFVTMVYGPIAAFLVEFFPARIRYTSLSIPYHIGNGWFGGFLPLIAAGLLSATGNLYAGLIYPIVVALITVVVGGLYIRETRNVRIWDEVSGDAISAAPVTG
jgi:MFS family permease